MLAGGFALFLWELRNESASLAEARTTVVNAIVMMKSVSEQVGFSLHFDREADEWFAEINL